MYRKTRIAILIVGLTLSAVGIRLYDLLVNTVLSSHNVRWKIDLSSRIQIDLYGAIIPTTISILLVLCLFFLKELSLKRYFHYFLLSTVLVFAFFRVSGTAIVGLYIMFTISVSFLAMFISFHNGTLWELLKTVTCTS